jgi:hypothetical protein
MGSEENLMTSAVSWVGNSCVLYAQVPAVNSHIDYSNEEVQLLNIHTSMSQKPSALFAFPNWSVASLTEARDSAIIRQTDSAIFIETKGKKWMFSGKIWGIPKAPPAHIIGGWKPSSIPAECK